MKHPWLIALPLMLAACVPDRCNTPFGIGGQFDLSLPSYAPLASLGALTVTHDLNGYEVGHRGIYIRRISYSDFVAFDCSCPNDHNSQLLPDEENDMLLRCPLCNSAFETVYGNPLEGSATSCPLYQYNTSFDGHYLSVY